MPDPTPQEPKQTPPAKTGGKSFFSSFFKKKERTAVPEGAKPIELPKASETKKNQDAPSLPVDSPKAAGISKLDTPTKEVVPPRLEVTKPEPSKHFKSLDLFKKDREERTGIVAPPQPISAEKPVEPKKPQAEVKKEISIPSVLKVEPKKEIPTVSISKPPLSEPAKKVETPAPAQVSPAKDAPKPVEPPKQEKPKEVEPPKQLDKPKETAPAIPPASLVAIPATEVPVSVKAATPPPTEKAKETAQDKDKKTSPEPKTDKKDEPVDAGKMTIQKMEAGKPRERRGGRAIVDMPSPEKRGERSYGLFSKRIVIILAALMISVSLFSVFYFLRETRLQISIRADGIELTPQVYVIYDFSDRVEMIKRNLEARRAPVRELLDDALSSLNAAQADYAGKMQRKKLLQENIEKDQAEIPAMLTRTRNELDTLWEKESKKLDNEYSNAKSEFNKAIEDKAKALGLKYNTNPELDAPEVAVNAFRLSLYGAPKGVDVGSQRKWAEDLLVEWREKEKTWSAAQQKIRKDADRLREPVGGMISEIRKRAEFLQAQITEVNDELALIQNEINRFGERVALHQKEMEDLIKPFYDELLRVPGDYQKLVYSMTTPGMVDIREIDKSKDFPPGQYRLLVRGTKDGEEYWAITDFHLKQYKTNKVEIGTANFERARKLIDKVKE